MSYNYGKPLLQLAEIVHSKSCAEDFPNRELLKQNRPRSGEVPTHTGKTAAENACSYIALLVLCADGPRLTMKKTQSNSEGALVSGDFGFTPKEEGSL